MELEDSQTARLIHMKENSGTKEKGVKARVSRRKEIAGIGEGVNEMEPTAEGHAITQRQRRLESA